MELRTLFISIEHVLPTDVRDVAKKARRTIEEKQNDRVRLQRLLDRDHEREERERNVPIEHWDFMVAGCKYEGRPSTIDLHAEIGGSLYLVRDRGNQHSRNAVEVRTTRGYQIGYVPEEDATDIAPLLDDGHPYVAEIKRILRGGRYPIPVVIADIYRKDAAVPNLTQAQAQVPQPFELPRRSSSVKFVVLAIIAILILVYLLK